MFGSSPGQTSYPDLAYGPQVKVCACVGSCKKKKKMKKMMNESLVLAGARIRDSELYKIEKGSIFLCLSALLEIFPCCLDTLTIARNDIVVNVRVETL